MTQLLAPAGSPEALFAAVQGGADAVYMGFGTFNARQSAHNFAKDEFAAAVRYCHVYGVKVYLTLNTLLSDRELPDAAELLRYASDIGVDAVLVQDWGVFTLLQAVAPDLCVHASTQMSIHTLGGANTAARWGLRRVVLARELDREETKEICSGCDAEIESFVHGALCMCYSGQCAMSALIGQRSGNRGRCAQPCRLPYGVNGPCRDARPMSLKDNNLSAHLNELSDMGVACLKLEGRMKRPEYVYAVTQIYRRLLDERRRPTKEEQAKLAAAFSRDGFTDGYWTGKHGTEMFGMRAENEHWPEEWFSQLRLEYEKSPRRVAVDMRIVIAAQTPACLTVTDGRYAVSVNGSVPEAARSRALTAQELTTRLRKTGGTCFCVQHVEVALEEGLVLTAAAVNALRREALSKLEAARAALPARRVFPTPELPQTAQSTAQMRFTVSLTYPEQLTAALMDCQPEMVYIPVEKLDTFALRDFPTGRFCAVLPRIYHTKDEPILRGMLEKHLAQLTAVTVGNIGHLSVIDALPLERRGDYGLNIFNSRAIAFWREQGLSSVTLSFELRHQQVRDLQKALPCESIVYGRLPLMITENCPAKNSGCCGKGRGAYLTDRTGAVFPTVCAYGCRCEVLNAAPLYLADKPEYRAVGLSLARLRFTDESPDECVKIFRAYCARSDYRPEMFTRGLFYRGVE